MPPAIPASDPLPSAVDGASPAPSEPGALPLEVRERRPEDVVPLEAWLSERGATVFQRPAWLRAVERVFGHEPRELLCTRGEAVVGYLPLMRCRRLTSGSHLISTPYGVYGGPVVETEDGAEIESALVERALQEARRLGVGRLELRAREPLAHPGLTASDLYVTFVKDLPEDYDGVLRGMKKDERRLVRRAADTHGLELDEGSWYLEDLARLFQASKQRLGSPGLPPAWFRALAEELGEAAPVHIVRRGSQVLAASQCFVDGEDLRMYYIGTTPEANRAFAATSFMIAELQRWAIERGLRRFDLGRSRRDAGAVKFKTNQGFAPEPLHYAYGLVRSKGLPSFTPSNPRTALLRRTWTRLPAWLARRLSARLAPFLP